MNRVDFTLDALGLFCPIPVILTSKKIEEMAPDQILEVLSDDYGIKKDMPTWCRNSGNEFLYLLQEGTIFKIYIRKKIQAC